MGGVDLDVEQLCFRLRAKLRRNGADKAWIETELLEDGANLTERDRRFFQLQVNNVVIAIDLVAQTGNRFEFVIKFQDFIQIAQAGRVNFQFRSWLALYKRAALDAKKKRRRLRGAQS